MVWNKEFQGWVFLFFHHRTWVKSFLSAHSDTIWWRSKSDKLTPSKKILAFNVCLHLLLCLKGIENISLHARDHKSRSHSSSLLNQVWLLRLPRLLCQLRVSSQISAFMTETRGTIKICEGAKHSHLIGSHQPKRAEITVQLQRQKIYESQLMEIPCCIPM